MHMIFLLENLMRKGDIRDKKVQVWDNIITQKPMYMNQNSTLTATKSALEVVRTSTTTVPATADNCIISVKQSPESNTQWTTQWKYFFKMFHVHEPVTVHGVTS